MRVKLIIIGICLLTLGDFTAETLGPTLNVRASETPNVRDRIHRLNAKDNRVELSPEVIALGKTVLSKLDQTKNTGREFDYWPRGGIRIAYRHIATFATYEMVNRISPHPVFLSGPHDDKHLNLHASYEFGHYNPKFLKWLYENLTEILRDRSFVKSTSVLFEQYLQNTAILYFSVYKELNKNSKEMNLLLNEYKNLIDDKTLPSFYYYDVAWEEAGEKYKVIRKLHKAYNPNLIASAVYFWLRRRIDGTHEQVYAILQSLLMSYGQFRSGPH